MSGGVEERCGRKVTCLALQAWPGIPPTPQVIQPLISSTLCPAPHPAPLFAQPPTPFSHSPCLRQLSRGSAGSPGCTCRHSNTLMHAPRPAARVIPGVILPSLHLVCVIHSKTNILDRSWPRLETSTAARTFGATSLFLPVTRQILGLEYESTDNQGEWLWEKFCLSEPT